MTKRYRVAVIGLDHMHAGDQITLAREIDTTELVAVWDTDSDRLGRVCDDLSVQETDRYTELDRLLEERSPHVAVICSATSDHEALAERFAAAQVNILLEKPFAADLHQARNMIKAAAVGGVLLGVNWPLAWYPSHRTTRRLIADGIIGPVTEVHYYDGNRGPLFHTHGKQVVDDQTARSIKRDSWWYSADRGGGSLRDYLGYGTTIATWFRDGEMPDDVLARTYHAAGDAVDEQSVVIASYHTGLSTFQTRWGTFTDPWTHQPAPRCGFVVVGAEGTIASWDYADHVTVQTMGDPAGHPLPVDDIPAHERSALANLTWCLSEGVPLYGPLSAETSLAGQQILQAAIDSVETGALAVLGGAS